MYADYSLEDDIPVVKKLNMIVIDWCMKRGYMSLTTSGCILCNILSVGEQPYHFYFLYILRSSCHPYSSLFSMGRLSKEQRRKTKESVRKSV